MKANSRKKFRPFRLYSEEELRSARLRRKALTAFTGAVAALAVAAIGFVYYSSFFEKTSSAQLATQSAALSSKVGGKIAKILVKETQVVKAGDVLMQLDSKEFQAVLDERKRELSKHEDQLEGGKIHLGRLAQKAADGESAQKQYADAKAWWLRLQAKVQKMREGVAEAQTQLDSTKIVAPANGHVARKLVDVGADVSAGQPVFHFVGVGMPWLVANFKDHQLEKMKIGQKTEIIVPSTGKVYVGRVESLPPVASQGEPETLVLKIIKTFMQQGKDVSVKIALDEKSVAKDVTRLMNGSPAEVKVYLKM